MKQIELLPQDEYAALADDVDAIGRKEVATMFKGSEPDFDPEDGSKWVSNCLDPDRKHKFDLIQISTIINEARKRGSYSYVTYLLKHAYFEPPVPKTYEVEVTRISDRMEKLQQAFQACNVDLQNATRELKK